MFSPNSKRIAYVGAFKKGETGSTGRVVVIDGKVSEEYEEIYPHQLVFSNDSKSFSYVAWRAGKRFLIREGKTTQSIEGKPSFMLVEMQYTPDDKHLVWIDKSGEGASIVFDGIKGKLWDDISGLSFAPKSSVCAYVSKTKDDKYVVVVGEKESIEYDGVLNARVYWSPRGDDYAYVAGRKTATGMEAVLVRNGVEQAKGKTFRAISHSPDGKRFSYGIVTSDQEGVLKAYMVLDGTTSRPYDGLGEDSSFSPNSKRFVYIGATTSQSGKGMDIFYVIDGKQNDAFDSVGKQVSWSPDSKHYAYCAFRGDTTLIVQDGRVLGTYADAVLPMFSLDSIHLIWWANLDNKWYVVVNGQSVGKPFDSWLSKNWVEDSNGLHGIGLREHEVIRIDIK